MKKVILILMLLILTSCTIEQDTEKNTASKETTTQNSSISEEPKSESQSISSDSLDLSDFPGANRIEEYSGQIT